MPDNLLDQFYAHLGEAKNYTRKKSLDLEKAFQATRSAALCINPDGHADMYFSHLSQLHDLQAKICKMEGKHHDSLYYALLSIAFRQAERYSRYPPLSDLAANRKQALNPEEDEHRYFDLAIHLTGFCEALELDASLVHVALADFVFEELVEIMGISQEDREAKESPMPLNIWYQQDREAASEHSSHSLRYKMMRPISVEPIYSRISEIHKALIST